MTKYQIQARVNGQWATDFVGSESANSFESWEEAVSSLTELLDSFELEIDSDGTDNSGSGVTLATDCYGKTHEFKIIEVPEKQKESESMRIGRQRHEEFEKAWRTKWQADLIATVF